LKYGSRQAKGIERLYGHDGTANFRRFDRRILLDASDPKSKLLRASYLLFCKFETIGLCERTVGNGQQKVAGGLCFVSRLGWSNPLHQGETNLRERWEIPIGQDRNRAILFSAWAFAGAALGLDKTVRHKTLRLSEKNPTLFECSVIILLLGLLLTVAIPKYLDRPVPYDQSHSHCIANLKQIDSAKEQWAMDNKKGPGVPVTFKDLAGATLYMKSKPTCPKGGIYVVGVVGKNPRCTQEGHELP
jgi:hypothetical protein